MATDAKVNLVEKTDLYFTAHTLDFTNVTKMNTEELKKMIIDTLKTDNDSIYFIDVKNIADSELYKVTVGFKSDNIDKINLINEKFRDESFINELLGRLDRSNGFSGASINGKHGSNANTGTKVTTITTKKP
eukprot:UN00558